jgi:hypothetical protein
MTSVDLIWQPGNQAPVRSVSVTFIYGHLCGLTDSSIWFKLNYDISGTARDRNNDADLRKDYPSLARISPRLLKAVPAKHTLILWAGGIVPSR